MPARTHPIPCSPWPSTVCYTPCVRLLWSLLPVAVSGCYVSTDFDALGSGSGRQPADAAISDAHDAQGQDPDAEAAIPDVAEAEAGIADSPEDIQADTDDAEAPDADPDSEDAPDDTPHEETGTACSHDFCDEFDGPDPWALWGYYYTEGANLTLDATSFRSAPTSLRVDFPSTGGGPAAREGWVQSTFTVASKIRLAFDLELPLSDDSGDVHVAVIEPVTLPSGYEYAFVALAIDWADLDVVAWWKLEGSPDDNLYVKIGAKTSPWRRLNLEWETQTGKMTGWPEGAAPTSGTTPFALPADSEVRVAVGVRRIWNSEPWVVRIDDVAIDVE